MGSEKLRCYLCSKGPFRLPDLLEMHVYMAHGKRKEVVQQYEDEHELARLIAEQRREMWADRFGRPIYSYGRRVQSTNQMEERNNFDRGTVHFDREDDKWPYRAGMSTGHRRRYMPRD